MRIKRPEPRFAECPGCLHFRPGNAAERCRGCGVGEHFEEYIEEFDPDEDEMMLGFKGRGHDEED